ncbi:HVO_0416 family zinc finger protein [Halopelagius fulvigenes]|uniref:HVO_0416 family zinc finger protein n=1 Tax=Halopelagius fulvigenes TaxID=1198324 RepID=A0ABD5U1F2_9EURY
MASAPNPDDALFDQFLDDRGHEVTESDWEASYNKKQCPECGALHDQSADDCTVCGWDPLA